MENRRVAIASVLLLLAVSCAPEPERPARQRRQTFSVILDPKVEGLSTEFTSYFPSELAVRPGDSVEFKVHSGSGIPHTVTFGSLVDDAVERLRGLGPTASLAMQETELAKLPDVFPHEPGQGGPPKLNQSAVQPCNLADGEPPNSLSGGAPACEDKQLPAFAGNSSFYNSGILNEDADSWKMNVAADAKPGTYTFVCLVHRGSMRGELTVVEKDRGVADASKVRQEGKEQISEEAAKLKKAVDEAGGAGADNALAGVGSLDAAGIATEFVPKSVSVPVGGTVTWKMLYFHTVGFNPDEDAIGLISKSGDEYELNSKIRPINSPPLPPEYQSFPPKTAAPKLLDGGRFVGVGSKSSGLLGSIPPAVISYKVAFPQAGTYEVRCQVHPEMKASVKVG